VKKKKFPVVLGEKGKKYLLSKGGRDWIKQSPTNTWKPQKASEGTEGLFRNPKKGTHTVVSKRKTPPPRSRQNWGVEKARRLFYNKKSANARQAESAGTRKVAKIRKKKQRGGRLVYPLRGSLGHRRLKTTMPALLTSKR